MDDILTFADEAQPGGPGQGAPWKILIADDDPAVHLVTKLALGDFTFEGRRLELYSAYGEDDTRKLIAEHPDTALILLDVVMDTMDSGFELVRYIRETLRNKDVRIIMRTGQSGNAPEDRIIIDYDINDFKDKTELTVAKLRTTLISSLRTYSHLKIIAEEQRKSSANRAYLHTIIDSLSSVLITLDLDQRVVLWNREAERWTAIPAAAAFGRNLFEVAPVFEPLKALFQDVLSAQKSGRLERTAVPLWKDGQVFVHLILQVLDGSNGREILFRLDDRTLAKQQNDQILRSQKVNAFSSLAAGVAGELSEVLLSAEGDAADRIRAWGQRASGLLDRLARFSPLSDPERQALDWAALVAQRVASSPPGREVTLHFDGPADGAFVGAHPGGLEAIVDNLLENAADAMSRTPGTIEVSLRREDLGAEDRLKPLDLQPGPYWVLTVRDHGVGMSPEVASQVFDPYFTTKPDGRGLGLGLPLVYSLAEGLSGFVELTSSPGAGTEVRVSLPAWTPPGTAPQGHGTILLCDDEPLLRQAASRILRHRGYLVLEAADGPSALELFRSHRAEVSLVLLDMVLPGMGGVEVFRRIRAEAPEVPVLLSSGFGRSDQIQEALDAGLKGFLQKPYRAEDLLKAVERVLVS
jgi:CheY-like chemotaxis protein